MAFENGFPREISAGLTFQAVLTLAAYPAPDWSIVAHLRGPAVVDLEALSTGTRHVFTAPASTTKDWPKGRYWYSVRASRGGDVIQVDRGELIVSPDMAAAPEGFDGRSENQVALDSINAVLSRRATMDQERYTINNRELWRTPIGDLLKLRAFYATRVRQEKGGVSGIGRQIPVIFK